MAIENQFNVADLSSPAGDRAFNSKLNLNSLAQSDGFNHIQMTAGNANDYLPAMALTDANGRSGEDTQPSFYSHFRPFFNHGGEHREGEGASPGQRRDGEAAFGGQGIHDRSAHSHGLDVQQQPGTAGVTAGDTVSETPVASNPGPEVPAASVPAAEAPAASVPAPEVTAASVVESQAPAASVPAPEVTAAGAPSSVNVVASTPVVEAPPSPTLAALQTTPVYTATGDLAAAAAISAMPNGSAASMEVGASGDPSVPANTQTLASVTIDGNSNLSQLSAYGTLTDDNGAYTLDGNGNQLPALNLLDVSNLTITNAVFDNVSGSGAVTISGNSANDTVENSTFNNIGSGVDVYQVGNVAPSGIDILNNTFSNLMGPWPSASAVQFGGAGSSEVAALSGATNDVSHNTIIDGASLASPNTTNSALNGQDIISIYNYGNGAGENVQTLASSNLIDGSYMPADGSAPPDTAMNAELSTNVIFANNLAESQSAGIANDGSTSVTIAGNYVDNAVSAYNNGAEGGINPSGEWIYNNSNITPQVAINSGNASAGWPEVYSPSGPPNSPNNTNNWNA